MELWRSDGYDTQLHSTKEYYVKSVILRVTEY